MWARCVFTVSMAIAVLSGTALFWGSFRPGALWLDALFLMAFAASISLGIFFLARRLRAESEGVERATNEAQQRRKTG